MLSMLSIFLSVSDAAMFGIFGTTSSDRGLLIFLYMGPVISTFWFNPSLTFRFDNTSHAFKSF